MTYLETSLKLALRDRATLDDLSRGNPFRQAILSRTDDAERPTLQEGPLPRRRGGVGKQSHSNPAELRPLGSEQSGESVRRATALDWVLPVRLGRPMSAESET